MAGSLWRKLGEGYFLLGVWLFGDALSGPAAEPPPDVEAERGQLVILTADDEEARTFVEALVSGLAGS